MDSLGDHHEVRPTVSASPLPQGPRKQAVGQVWLKLVRIGAQAAAEDVAVEAVQGESCAKILAEKFPGNSSSLVVLAFPDHTLFTPEQLQEFPPNSTQDAPFVVYNVKELDNFLQTKQIPNTWHTLATHAGAQQRLIYAVAGDRIRKTSNFLIEFDKFCSTCPAWKNLDVNTARFWDTQANSSFLVLRWQHSGLCYMHAPVVLQHYKVAMFKLKKGLEVDHKMIDIGLFVREHMPSSLLQAHLCNNDGGSSTTFLETIAQLTHEQVVQVSLDGAAIERNKRVLEIKTYMNDYGPALVSSFRVDKNFHTSEKVSYLEDSIDAVLEGHHAMLLIGYRQDPRGECIFLLQNWWQSRFFIEVSATYLAKSRAKITFISGDLEEIPKEFKTKDAEFVETTD